MLLFGATALWGGLAYFLWIALRGRRGGSRDLGGEYENGSRDGT
jgi:hypothetical protein